MARLSYDVFVDGSAYTDIPDKKFGIGGIFYPKHNRRLCASFSETLFGDHNSFTAELHAATHALRMIPEGSDVVLHSDLKKLCKHVRKDKLLEWSLELDHPASAQACRDLFNAVARHNDVTAVFKRSKEHPLLLASHHLARAGANRQPVELITHIELDGPAAPPRRKGQGTRSLRERLAITISLEATGGAYVEFLFG